MINPLLITPSRATDALGVPYGGAVWSFYISGTLTPLTVYADSALTTPLGVTVTADAGGKFVNIYFDGTKQYRGILKNSSGSITIFDSDPISQTSALLTPTSKSQLASLALNPPLAQFDGYNWELVDYAPISVLVNGDTGQGVHVRSTTDTSKVWVRQFTGPVKFEWFGADPAIADNAPAFVAIGSYLRAGGIYNVESGPGTFLWNHNNCLACFVDIPKLRWKSYKSKFKNTYNWAVSGYHFDKMQHWPVTRRDAVDILKLTLNSQGRFIEDVLPGATSVVFKTTGNPSYTYPYAYPVDTFIVGQWVLVGSVDIQPGPSYPPCLNNFDIRQIKTVSGTGMTFETSLSYPHYSNQPDMWSPTWDPGTVATGKARVWNLELYDKWDIDHHYEGLDLLFTDFPYIGSQAYINSWGRKFTWVDCRLPGFGVSVCDEYTLQNCDIYFNGEIDKMNRMVTLLSCTFRDSFNVTSSSTDYLVAKNCKFFKGSKLFGIDGLSAKHVYVEDSYIENLSPRTVLGLSLSKEFVRCTITGIDNTEGNYFADTPLPISSGISYANGVFTIPKLDAEVDILAQTTLRYAAVPGTQVNFAGPADVFTGDVFSGRVISISETAAAPLPGGNYVITTDLKYATIPTAALGIGAGTPKIRVMRDGPITYRDCNGSNYVRVASDASAKGVRPFEYREATYVGESGQVTSMFSVGTIAKISVNVIKPSTAAGTFTLSNGSYQDDDFSIAAKSLSLVFDLQTRGLRSYDLVSLAGKKAGDSATFFGSAITALPANRWTNQNSFVLFSYNPVGVALKDLPVVEITIETDCGQSRKLLPTYKDPSGIFVANIPNGLQ